VVVEAVAVLGRSFRVFKGFADDDIRDALPCMLLAEDCG
jgi:hypothetical protein